VESGDSSNDSRVLFKEETKWVCSILKLSKSSFLFNHILSFKIQLLHFQNFQGHLVFLHL
jgi:hypothetical protein